MAESKDAIFLGFLFMNPGDTLEGHGLLWQQGHLVAHVDYYLTIPRELYFVINPGSDFKRDYEAHLGGFIYVPLTDATSLTLDEYTLELADKTKKVIRIEHRYKQNKRRGQLWLSFWVKVTQ
jgi:hypothetical protein